MSAGNNDPLAVAKTVYQAVDRDRALMESMVDEAFTLLARSDLYGGAGIDQQESVVWAR